MCIFNIRVYIISVHGESTEYQNCQDFLQLRPSTKLVFCGCRRYLDLLCVLYRVFQHQIIEDYDPLFMNTFMSFYKQYIGQTGHRGARAV